jgi:alkanesulfonate monooxygenase SsuD/methylene tetrahydromethanopterin reductase-like flavin-dependent oxidoreductase (luciferase family)
MRLRDDPNGNGSRLGLSLWTMQSTAAAPRHPTAMYRELAEDARLAEELGFHSLWTAEHRGWYDGWCPAPVHALAHAAAATERLHVGTAMLLAPQHDPAALADAERTFLGLFGDRLELGVGLGYRDAEFDALALRRDRRGRLMDEALARLEELRAGRRPLWVGGMAPAALARAARFGHGLLVPPTVSEPTLCRLARDHRVVAGSDVRVAVTRDVWIGDDPERFRALLRRHYREEIGAWWPLRGRPGFRAPDLLDAQLDRIDAAAIAGPPRHVADALDRLLAAGVDLLVVRLVFDFLSRAELHEQMHRLAADVAPLLDARRVAA